MTEWVDVRVSGFKSLQSRDDEVLEDNVDHDLLTGEEEDVSNKQDNSQRNRGEEDHRWSWEEDGDWLKWGEHSLYTSYDSMR